jgi:uncharacterized lipoprotein YmbA
MERFRLLSVILFAVLLIMGGCALMGKGTQQPTKSYVLHSLYSEETKPQPVTDLHDVGILVGPLRMAMYLDRSDVVIRDSQNRIDIADFSQWAGPLQENFSRVLAENLSVLLETHRVGIFPGTQAQVFDYNVTVDVNQFDGIPGGKTHLRARWVILDKTRKKVLFEKHSLLNQSTKDDSIEAMVAAQSRTVADLSREIAEAIKALSEGKKQGQ